MSKILKIKNPGLTGYYLQEHFVVDHHFGKGPDGIIKAGKETGLVFIQKDAEDEETIELHYKNEKDLEAKLSYILMILTDK